MKKLTINPSNKRYYSDEYIKGWENGVKAQYKATKDAVQGEWVLECDSEGEGDNLYRCSKCGYKYGCQEYDKPNFCPNCGVDMRIGVV